MHLFSGVAVPCIFIAIVFVLFKKKWQWLYTRRAGLLAKFSALFGVRFAHLEDRAFLYYPSYSPCTCHHHHHQHRQQPQPQPQPQPQQQQPLQQQQHHREAHPVSSSDRAFMLSLSSRFNPVPCEHRADTLVISFAGGALLVAGHTFSEFRNTLSQLNFIEFSSAKPSNSSSHRPTSATADMLFLSDPRQSFYLHSLSSPSSSSPTSSSLSTSPSSSPWTNYHDMRALIKKYKTMYKRVVLIGACLGASAVLMHSDLASLSIAFNPIVSIDDHPLAAVRIGGRLRLPKYLRQRSRDCGTDSEDACNNSQVDVSNNNNVITKSMIERTDGGRGSLTDNILVALHRVSHKTNHVNMATTTAVKLGDRAPRSRRAESERNQDDHESEVDDDEGVISDVCNSLVYIHVSGLGSPDHIQAQQLRHVIHTVNFQDSGCDKGDRVSMFVHDYAGHDLALHLKKEHMLVPTLQAHIDKLFTTNSSQQPNN